MARFDRSPLLRHRSLAALAAIALLAGCADRTGVIPSQSTPLASEALLRLGVGASSPAAGPLPCKGQKSTKTSSSAVETLSSKSSALCIPTFHGLGGSLEYPGATPSGKVTVTSTTIDNGFPYPGSGTPLFYLEIALPAATTFGSTLHASPNGLTGKTIKAKADYTVFSSYLKFGFWYGGSSCYTVATPGKYGGVLPRLGAVLEGQNFGGAYTVLLEVYPNQQSGTAC